MPPIKLILGALALFVAGTLAAVAGASPGQDAVMSYKGKQHAWLASLAGEYTAKLSGTLGESEGTYTIEPVLGGLWISAHLDAPVFGMPYQGTELLGYDPQVGRFVSVWADSMTPKLSTSEGTYDEATRTLTMRGISVGMDGETGQMVNTVVFRDDGMTFAMAIEGMELFSIDYTRKAR